MFARKLIIAALVVESQDVLSALGFNRHFVVVDDLKVSNVVRDGTGPTPVLVPGSFDRAESNLDVVAHLDPSLKSRRRCMRPIDPLIDVADGAEASIEPGQCGDPAECSGRDHGLAFAPKNPSLRSHRSQSNVQLAGSLPF